MKLIKDFYENFVQMDSGYATKPQLVLLCEDDKHTIEVFKTIVANKLEISKATIVFNFAEKSVPLETRFVEIIVK